MLVAGNRLVDVDHALGMSHGSARNYLRFLDPDQVAQQVADQVEEAGAPDNYSVVVVDVAG